MSWNFCLSWKRIPLVADQASTFKDWTSSPPSIYLLFYYYFSYRSLQTCFWLSFRVRIFLTMLITEPLFLLFFLFCFVGSELHIVTITITTSPPFPWVPALCTCVQKNVWLSIYCK
jgi:hypothetical protein